MRESEAFKRAVKAIRESLGPVFGNPEYLAKPGNVERLEARQQRAAESHASLALCAFLDPYDTALNAWLCERTNQPARDIQRIIAALHEACSPQTDCMEQP